MILTIELWDCVWIKSVHFVTCSKGLEGLLETEHVMVGEEWSVYADFQVT